MTERDEGCLGSHTDSKSQSSVAFDATVDIANEGLRSKESNRSEYKERAVAENTHVSKEEGRLHKASHARLEFEVIKAIPKDKQGRRSTYI